MNVKTILRWVLAAFLLFLSFGGGNAPAIILLIAAAVLVAPSSCRKNSALLERSR